MKYEMEELVPIVAKLAESYTSKESTSITYERAQQLMEAVLYCIHEVDERKHFSLIKKDRLSANEFYEIGASLVKEKVKETLELYNKMMMHFLSYGNECLYDTVAKGLPEFFKWYDCRYEPQNTILTLDYPVLVDITELTGVDKIHAFVLGVQSEQSFLNRFPRGYVVEILSRYDKAYQLMIDNICEIVLMNVLGHLLAEKEMSNVEFEPGEYQKLQGMIQSENLQELRSKLKNAIERMVGQYYENDEKLMEYLYLAVDNISVRMKLAADNGKLNSIL